MKGYGPTTFGDLNAEAYDALHDPGTTEESVELIAELAGDGAILELAIGTGRMALPLAQRGLNISGFDASPDMLAKLAAKPGGAAIPAWIAEMASFELGQRFDFAFLVFNTLYNLTTQEAQVQCFQRVAAHLNPGGRFLVEAFMPTRERFRDTHAVRTRKVGFDSVLLEAVDHDPITQKVDYQYIRISKDGTALKPLPMRYVLPAELDLMAQLAGLVPVDKWGGWHKQALTASSDMYVALYERPLA